MLKKCVFNFQNPDKGLKIGVGGFLKVGVVWEACFGVRTFYEGSRMVFWPIYNKVSLVKLPEFESEDTLRFGIVCLKGVSRNWGFKSEIIGNLCDWTKLSPTG